MNRNNKAFIELLEQQRNSESYANRARLLISKLSQKNKELIFETTTDLTAIEVSEDDTEAIDNHTKLKVFESQLVTLEKGSSLIFVPSMLPHELSDHYLKIQHVLDGKGQLYRLCVEGIFTDARIIRHYELNLLEPKVWVASSSVNASVKETKYVKRRKVVDKWMEAKKKHLNLKPDSTPQEIHDRLTTQSGKEKTQGWYWREWHGLDSDLFPLGYDERNFFKQYKEISFSKGNR